jgi:hypothetical protein
MPKPPRLIEVHRDPPLVEKLSPREADLLARFFARGLCTTSSERIHGESKKKEDPASNK